MVKVIPENESNLSWYPKKRNHKETWCCSKKWSCAKQSTFLRGLFFLILCNVFAYISKLTVANVIYGIINKINDLFCKYL